MFLNSFLKNTVRRDLGFKFKCGRIERCEGKTPTEILNRKTVLIRQCQFHTTSPRNAFPPILVLLGRYLIKFGAMISGRRIRKWWTKLPPEDREKVLSQIRSKKSKIACAGTVLGGGMLLYYLEHIVEDPITKRKKFIMISQKQMKRIADFEFKHQLAMFRQSVIPSSHPLYRRVLRVANNLLLSNADLEEIKNKVWSVTVIDRPDITNAFALPHGKIFVFSGMLNICTNDDQLAVVLAHEMAHSILSHVAENMSRIYLIEFLLMIPIVVFCVVFPDPWGVFSSVITSYLTTVLFQLPFSRSIEKEADLVGLHLAARSCYDVREAPVFWGKMKSVSENAPPEWLSTHPSHEARQVDLHDLLPHALRVREVSKCPPLGIRFW